MNRRNLLTGGSALAGAAVLERCSSPGGGARSIALVDPRGGAQVIAGPADLPSARYFTTAFEELTGAKLDIVSEPGKRPRGARYSVRSVGQLAGERSRISRIGEFSWHPKTAMAGFVTNRQAPSWF